jgi:hypothetical protein
MVARWLFHFKIQNLGIFRRALEWNSWHTLRPLEIYYAHLIYFVVVWYIFPILVRCNNKCLATLHTIGRGKFYVTAEATELETMFAKKCSQKF